MHQFLKDLGAAVWYAGRDYRRRPDQAFPIQPRKQVLWITKEDGEAERKKVGGVPWPRQREDVSRDLEGGGADGDVDRFLVELGDELGEGVELGVGEETDEVGGVSGPDVVALKVQGDVFEGDWVAVDVEGADGGGWVLSGVGSLFELAEEILGEVGGGCGGVSYMYEKGMRKGG